MGLRVWLKEKFDRIVFTYPRVNWLLRNLNKKLSSFTSFRLRPFGVMKVQFADGVSFKMETNETSSVTKLLFWKGPDNYEYTRVFEKLVPRCASFLDVGANTGYYSLLAAVRNPRIRVYAFEPAFAPYFYLTRNVTINNLSNVETFDIALSDREGEIEFFEVHNPPGYHSKYNLAGTGTLKNEDLNSQFVSRKVRTTTLDDWLDTKGIAAVDLIKLDTEGTENLILEGADILLREHQPIIICEILFNVIENKLQEIMSRYDYHFFYYSDGKLIKTPVLAREKDNGYRDCFFVPSEKLEWIRAFE